MSRPPKRPVLVVEDDPDTREAVLRLLHVRRLHTMACEDGLQALAYLRGGGPASVILLDLWMPRMDGRAFLDALGKDPDLARIPVVVFSGSTDGAVPGVVAQLRKGDDPEVILATIERACLKD